MFRCVITRLQSKQAVLFVGLALLLIVSIYIYVMICSMQTC
jgi:hypothetical protein